jgi:succinoglycan biosynthesis transport protein ExoP
MAEEFEEKPSEGIDWQYYSAVARRRSWQFLIPFFLGWLIVWGISWVLPSVYRSGTLILVEQPTVPQQFVVPNIAGNLQDRLQSITQQILSRTRLLHIIETLNLYEGERQQVTPDDLVDRMRKDIEIELVRDNRNELTAFNIYYSAASPHVAQQVTSELSTLFISENLEARQQQSENTTNFLESQVEEAKLALAEQEEKVRQFKDRYLGELPGQLQSNLQILSGLQGQLQTEEDALSRAKQQNAYLESLLAQYRTLQKSGQPGDNTPIGLPALDQELDKLKSQLADLSSHYTDRHPDVRKLKEQIAKTEKMKEQITADLASKASSSQADNNSAAAPRDEGEIRYSAPMIELQSQLRANQIEMTNHQHAIQELHARIGDYQARLNRAPVREQQFADLTRGYDQSRANYDTLLRKKNESELATNLEKRQEGEHFRILDPPSLPTKPYSPNRMRLCGVGLIVGLVLGGAIAAGTEFMDERIYSEKEFKKLLPMAVMAEIPNIGTEAEEKAQQKMIWSVWAAASLVLVSILAGSALSYFRG